jgi:DNA-binding NtrC family response regulator
MASVLVVEDETQVLVLAESVLREAGHDTTSASTLAEAKAIIDSDQELDLVFTDLGLGDQSEAGIAVGEAVVKKRPGLPVLYSSGRPVTDGMQTLFAARSAFLAKPYTVQALMDAVAELLKSS